MRDTSFRVVKTTMVSSMTDNDDWAEVEEEEKETPFMGLQTAAVEALIKDDTRLLDTVTLLTESLDSLKSSFDDNLVRVVKEIQSSNEKLDSKMSILSQNVHDLKLHVVNASKDMGALKMIIEDEKKHRALERALNLTKLDSFVYWAADNSGWLCSACSSELAKVVIDRFMLGQGAVLPSDSALTVDCDDVWREMSRDKKNALSKEFADKFASQIKTLIKHEPRLVKTAKEGIASYTIFH